MENNNYIILDGYYIDFDSKNQFRIFGPNNHLFIGLDKESSKDIKMYGEKVIHPGKISISIKLDKKTWKIGTPLQSDVRTFRANNGIEEGKLKTFKEMSDNKSLTSQNIDIKDSTISFSRKYGQKYYKVTFKFPKEASIKKTNKSILIKSNRELDFNIIAETNDISSKKILPKLKKATFNIPADLNNLKNCINKLYDQSLNELDHMLTWGKTSGDRFGTVFPRDWMESADLGRDFLPQKIYDLMYERALQHVNKNGEGWHEDLVGELAYNSKKNHKNLVNRDMIDIEPHYILGLSHLSKGFIKNNLSKFKAISALIVENANKKEFITFKKVTKKILKDRSSLEINYLKNKKYLPRGNWRDIPSSYGSIDEIIAPFDVNAVFYPKALEYIKKYDLYDKKTTEKLIKKWRNKKNEYLYEYDNNERVYALAKYGEEYNLLKVSHLDESYLFFYDNASEEETVSFAKRLLDKNYFYTKSGPVITEKHNSIGLNTKDYHGTVIWPKTTTFALLGLLKHYRIGKKNGWKKESLSEIKKSLIKTASNTLNTYCHLGAIPELYFDLNGKPTLFTSQLKTTEESSGVQLWSAVSYIAILNILKEIYGT